METFAFDIEITVFVIPTETKEHESNKTKSIKEKIIDFIKSRVQ